jgi:hypothetical protein
MRVIITIVGLVLILFGILAFAYNGVSFTQQQQVAQFGAFQVTADTLKTIHFPPLLSGLCIVGGIVLVVVSRIGKK